MVFSELGSASKHNISIFPIDSETAAGILILFILLTMHIFIPSAVNEYTNEGSFTSSLLIFTGNAWIGMPCISYSPASYIDLELSKIFGEHTSFSFSPEKINIVFSSF